MKQLYSISSLIFMILLFTSCKHSAISDLQPPPPPPADCDTVNISYSTPVQSIISANCFSGCHNGTTPTSGFLLETYDQVKHEVEVGHLMERIRHEQDSIYLPMPQPTGKLSDCQIAQFQKWIDLDFPQ